jgi:hypothetical protein
MPSSAQSACQGCLWEESGTTHHPWLLPLLTPLLTPPPAFPPHMSQISEPCCGHPTSHWCSEEVPIRPVPPSSIVAPDTQGNAARRLITRVRPGVAAPIDLAHRTHGVRSRHTRRGAASTLRSEPPGEVHPSQPSSRSSHGAAEQRRWVGRLPGGSLVSLVRCSPKELAAAGNRTGSTSSPLTCSSSDSSCGSSGCASSEGGGELSSALRFDALTMHRPLCFLTRRVDTEGCASPSRVPHHPPHPHTAASSLLYPAAVRQARPAVEISDTT